jgi:hypothetical protein
MSLRIIGRLILVVGPFVLFTGGGPVLAGAATPFTEEAISRGINYVVPNVLSIERFGRGLAFVDLDNDGDPDVVVTGRADHVVGIYENDGNGYFTDRSGASGIPLIDHASGVVALDYDGDHDQDLYFTCIDDTNVLARHDGNFQFTDVSAAAGVADPGRGTGAAVGDYDNDGWLDLYVPNYSGSQNTAPDRLFHNLGNGTFSEVAVAVLGLADPWRGWQAVFFDMDFDGDADLYVSNDKKVADEIVMHNRLFENLGGGVYNDISASSGTDANIYSMGVAVGDFDGNGLQDLYATNLAVEPNPLFLNLGGGMFTDATASAGVGSFRTGWGAAFFDYDNDGVLDLYVCNMTGPDIGSPAENRLYVHGPGWPCTDVAPEERVDDSADSFAMAVADVDDDGDLDLLVQSNDVPVRLYINRDGESRNWVKFDVVGLGANYFAVGAHIGVRVGTTWRYREIIAGGNNFKAQNELIVHFGLDTATLIDEIQVMWPGGTTRTLTNHQTNRTWRIYPPQRLGDSDANGVVNFDDVDDFASVMLGLDTDADHVALSDINGDSQVNGFDVQGFVAAIVP